VINRRECELGTPHPSASQPQALKCLGARYFVHEVPINVKQRGIAGCSHYMAIPYLFEQGLWHARLTFAYRDSAGELIM
jgi:hypothetical protein